jgi:carbon-monoxide dehydrogenase small subunit
MFAIQLNGCEVLTIEGLTPNGELHPLQEAFIQCHGLQCGFCTAGLLMCSLYLLNRNPDPNENDIRNAISGNLCRCTGYVNIVRAIAMASDLMNQRQHRIVG